MKINKNGFTLVELIIVIVIISILSTIGFITFSNYISKSKDTKKIIEINNINKALEISNIQVGAYPSLLSVSSTGNIKGFPLFTVGNFDENLQKQLKIFGLTDDGKYGVGFTYGISYNLKKFNIGTYVENYNNISFVSKIYAEQNSEVSYVGGNYNGILKFSTGGGLYLTNLPSLLINNTGSIDLFSGNDIYFIANNSKNIYHNIKNIEPVSNYLNNIYGSGTYLTGVLIDGVTKENIGSTFISGSLLLKSFGSDIIKISNELFGSKSQLSYNPCTYNGFTFQNGENKVFYSSQETSSCLSVSVIYSCNNGVVLDSNKNKISTPTSFQYEACVDNTTCKFNGAYKFDGTCHF